MIDSISGIPLYVNQYTCQPAEFVRWRRRHRKARIAKKWANRYGAVMTTCPGVYVMMAKTAYTKESIIACPCFMAKWKKYSEVMTISRQEVIEDRMQSMDCLAYFRDIRVDKSAMLRGIFKYDTVLQVLRGRPLSISNLTV